MKRLLVTGASGFIGRHCLPLLTDCAEETHAVTSTSITLADPSVYWHSADLLDAEQVSRLMRRVRPTHLLHLAWYTQPEDFWRSPNNCSWLDASLNLVQEFTRWSGEHAVLAGSCAEYDWSDGICREQSTPIRPQTPYGRCKAALYWASEAMSQTQGLRMAWARLFFLYGPGAPAPKFPAAIYHALAADQHAKCTSGQQQRDYLYVRDAASALVQLLQSDLTGAVNVASGVPQKLAEMAIRLATQMKKQHLLQLGTLPHRPEEPPLIVTDIGRLRDELGWKPAVRMDQGLAETIEWLERSCCVPVAA